MPHPPGRAAASSLPGVDDGTHRHRLNSRYLRELTHGKFIIKCEEITLLENIGQGIRMHVYIWHRYTIYNYIEWIAVCARSIENLLQLLQLMLG